MFRWLIGSSLEFRIAVLGVAAAMVVFGTLQIEKMPIDVFPEFKPITIEVQTEALGLSAKEVETTVTLIVEELLSGVPWLETFRSRSVTGLSSVVLTFERGTDLIRARQMVSERLADPPDEPLRQPRVAALRRLHQSEALLVLEWPAAQHRTSRSPI